MLDENAGTATLNVAVTGPTGTFGEALIPRLLADRRVGRVAGIARRPLDTAARGWDGLEYRRGDVRDRSALEEAFRGADVVVHLAFLVIGAGSDSAAREINIDGTLNAFRAAVACGAQRFVYASSVAAYGFHRDNPERITEDWPVRPAARLHYASEKAELERMLDDEAVGGPTELYLLRPPIVLGPHAVGAKNPLPQPLMDALGQLAGAVRRSPVPLPVPVPRLPVQFIHEDDVAEAFIRCIHGAGPPGAYNIAGDGVLTLDEVAREVGLRPVVVPSGPFSSAARALSAVRLPSAVPPVAEWAEALAHPPVMDDSRARRDLGWTPRYSALEALRATIG
jgi:nucleoside-diphosphate-sugar epimerase